MYGERNEGFRPRGSGGFGRSAPVDVGEEIDVKIEAVGEKGDGIARKKGFVLFVPNTKEGDEVRIRVTKVLRKVGFAEVIGEPQGSVEEEGEKPPQEEKEPEAPAPMPEPEPSPEDTEDFGEELEEGKEETGMTEEPKPETEEKPEEAPKEEAEETSGEKEGELEVPPPPETPEEKKEE